MREALMLLLLDTVINRVVDGRGSCNTEILYVVIRGPATAAYQRVVHVTLHPWILYRLLLSKPAVVYNRRLGQIGSD